MHTDLCVNWASSISLITSASSWEVVSGSVSCVVEPDEGVGGSTDGVINGGTEPGCMGTGGSGGGCNVNSAMGDWGAVTECVAGSITGRLRLNNNSGQNELNVLFN